MSHRDYPSASIARSLIGQVLDGRYRVTEALGEGAMGVVYKAEQIGDAPVAIKVLSDELAHVAEQRERFEREARALFALEHPNILAVHDFGVVDGSPYLVMELLEGETLDEHLEDRVLEPPRAIAIAREILSGLAFAHAKSILHRDLKSENVFLAKGGAGAKLLDFGLVKFTDDDRWGESRKLTVQGSVFGSPAYMAPEQCKGSPADASTDVYGMGCILCELLTGEWPFMEGNQIMMFRAHLMNAPDRLSDRSEDYDFCEELEALFQKALAKSQGDRFKDAGEMLAALDALPARLYWPKGQPDAVASPAFDALSQLPGFDASFDSASGLTAVPATETNAEAPAQANNADASPDAPELPIARLALAVVVTLGVAVAIYFSLR